MPADWSEEQCFWHGCRINANLSWQVGQGEEGAMQGDIDNSSTGYSRRDFLKGTGLIIGSAALATSIVNVAGCKASSSEVSTTTGSGTYEVYDTDILIVGNGLAGTQAAIEAHKLGAKVTVIEKGPFGFGGGAGMNWGGAFYYTTDPADPYGDAHYGLSLANPKILKALLDNSQDLLTNLEAFAMNQGIGVGPRLEDGSFAHFVVRPSPTEGSTIRLMFDFFDRHAMDAESDHGITMFDQTMITDLIVQEGQCLGAMGVHIPTGTFRVFRSKATLATTGGSSWIYGWGGTSAVTLNSPDNTGEVDVAAYRHGCALQDSEFFALDLIQLAPRSIAAAFPSGIGADASTYKTVCDSDGDYWMADIEHMEGQRARFAQEIALKIAEGKGGPNGGVFLDIPSEDVLTHYYYRRNIALWKKIFGIDVVGSKIEVGPEYYEHGAVPPVDEKLMTEISGLFEPRGGGVAGELGGGNVMIAMKNGPYAARNAVEYARTAKGVDVDWDTIAGEYSRIHELRTRSVEGGLRPLQVRRKIQEACYKALGIIRNGKDMQACVSELERIRDEDLPKQICADGTLVFNNEWKQAIENHSLMVIAEASAKSALMREGSRGQFLRTDFPEQDDTNWSVNILAREVDGTMRLETRSPATEA